MKHLKIAHYQCPEGPETPRSVANLISEANAFRSLSVAETIEDTKHLHSIRTKISELAGDIITFNDTQSCETNSVEYSDWMTIDEAAMYMRVSKQTIYNWRVKGLAVGKRRHGTGSLLFSKTELDGIVEGKRSKI